LIFFLTGAKAGFSGFKTDNRYDWLEEKQYKCIQMLDSVCPNLRLVDEVFALNEKEWKKWVFEGEPQNVPMPGEANN
jgi:hypothetical protein